MASQAWLIAIAVALLASPLLAQRRPPGMEDCHDPPLLLCPNKPGPWPSSEHPNPYLCERLGYAEADAVRCEGFIGQHRCPEILEAQMAADDRRGGNCYGGMFHNCCKVPVVVSLSLNPLPDKHGRIVALRVANGTLIDERLPARAQVIDLTIESNADVAVFWQDADEKLQTEDNKIEWKIQSVTAAKDVPAAPPSDP